jgi:hypothetical protein
MFPQQIRWQQQNGRSRAVARCRDERLVDIIAIRSATERRRVHFAQAEKSTL